MTEETKARVLQIQENLETVHMGECSTESNLDKAMQCEWKGEDGKSHSIVFIPAKDYSGVRIQFYIDNLNTAGIGLSTEATIHLMECIQKVVIDDRGFLNYLKEKKHG